MRISQLVEGFLKINLSTLYNSTISSKDIQSDNLKKTLMFLCESRICFNVQLVYRVCVCVCVCERESCEKWLCTSERSAIWSRRPGGKKRGEAAAAHTRWWLVITDKRERSIPPDIFKNIHIQHIFLFSSSVESPLKYTHKLSHPYFECVQIYFTNEKEEEVCRRGLGKWAERNSWLFFIKNPGEKKQQL
jgi:hypothetical protein